jgi:protein SCO1/2
VSTGWARRRRRAALAAALPWLLASAGRTAGAAEHNGPAPFPPEAEQTLAALQDVDVVEHLGERVPAGLVFRTPDGQKAELDAVLGRGPILVTLGYYRCPMLCSLVLDGLVKAMKQSGMLPGREFQAVSISIDPDEDAGLARQTQARIVGAVGGGVSAGDWPFWLGDATGSRMLAEAVGFKYVYDSKSKQFAHDAVSFVLTSDGRISRYLYGVDVLPRDFRLALVEAGGGRVGTSFDRLLLSCFQYDPVNRRYAPFVFGFMRIGAGLVFLMLATLMTVLWRKELVMRKRRVA